MPRIGSALNLDTSILRCSRGGACLGCCRSSFQGRRAHRRYWMLRTRMMSNDDFVQQQPYIHMLEISLSHWHLAPPADCGGIVRLVDHELSTGVPESELAHETFFNHSHTLSLNSNAAQTFKSRNYFFEDRVAVRRARLIQYGF